MKIARYEGDQIKIGAVKGEQVVDLVAADSRLTIVRDTAAVGREAVDELSALANAQKPHRCFSASRCSRRSSGGVSISLSA